MEEEQILCSECLCLLPETNDYREWEKSLAYERLKEKIPIQKAVSFLHYQPNGLGQKIVVGIEYNKNHTGKQMGAYMAQKMLLSDFFKGIDQIVPIPLHKEETSAKRI